MSDPRIQEILKALDPPPRARLWHGGASPLGSLRGVTAQQAAWKPAPERHSIWELALHMAYWKYAVRRRLSADPRGGFERSPSNWPSVPVPADERAWRVDRALLRQEHERLLDVIRGFDPRRLDRKPATGGEYTFMDLIVGVLMHDTYHTGQIQIMKRLYDSLGVE